MPKYAINVLSGFSSCRPRAAGNRCDGPSRERIPFWLNRGHVHKQELGSRTRYTLSTDDETEGEFTLGLVSLVIIFVAGIAITVAVRRHYRCPKCNEIPMGTWANFGPGSFGVNRGLDLFPVTCPNCGARLTDHT